MSDEDMIRRGDVLKVADAEMRRYGFGLPGGRGDQMQAAINAIPAVQPDVAALVEALEFYAAWEMEEMEPPTESELDLFDGILNCPMPKAFSDRGEIARAALARVKGVM